MANPDIPNGLYPHGLDLRVRKYVSGGTTDVFKGDIVRMDSDGKVSSITTTTGGTTMIGVAANYKDASAGQTEVWVYDHPDQQFIIQDDGASATPAQTNVGNTAPLVLGSGNTTTGLSAFELDISAAATGTADPLKIMGFLPGPGLSIGKNAKIIVRLQKHFNNERVVV